MQSGQLLLFGLKDKRLGKKGNILLQACLALWLGSMLSPP